MSISSERPLDKRRLDQKLVALYKNNDKLMVVLDSWILSPDSELNDDLVWAADFVMKTQNPKLPDILYRGMGTFGYQDTMGFTTGGFRNRVRDELMNKPVSRQITRPVSFTTNSNIARAFGNVIVTANGKDLEDHCLVITDELSAAVCLHRNLRSLVTQDEVVVLPSIKELELTLIKPPKPQSAFW